MAKRWVGFLPGVNNLMFADTNKNAGIKDIKGILNSIYSEISKDTITYKQYQDCIQILTEKIYEMELQGTFDYP